MSMEMIKMSPQRSVWASEEDIISQHEISSTIGKQNNRIIDLGNNAPKKSKLRSLLTFSCCQGTVIGALTAGLILAIVVTFWTTSSHVTSTTNTINTQITTTVTTTTETTSTSITTTTTVTTSPSCVSPSTVGEIYNIVSGFTPTIYTLHTYGFTANDSLATITFAVKGDNGPGQRYWLLDNVSINHTNTDTDVIINGGFETGNFTGWTQYCATDANCGGSGNYGQLTTSFYYSGTYCYVDKCGNDYDYLTQSFTTVSGDYYILSFYLRIYSNGPGPYRVYVMLT